MAHKKYKVKQGDSICSIAFEHGLFPDTIWNDAKNSSLKQERKDPNVLYPGDVVYVRDKEEKQASCANEQRHHFRRKGVPARFKLQLLRNNKPRKREKYVIDIEGQTYEGVTDSKGWLDHTVSPDAQKATLMLDDGDETYEILLGHLDPPAKPVGIQERLKNLGNYFGKIDGVMGPDTEDALKAFQADKGLNVTGQADQTTIDALQKDHHS